MAAYSKNAVVYSQFPCLPRQCSGIVEEPSYVAQCGIGRTKKHNTFRLVSGSGSFLAEMCAVAYFVLHAGYR